jgi:hypothetical protein
MPVAGEFKEDKDVLFLLLLLRLLFLRLASLPLLSLSLSLIPLLSLPLLLPLSLLLLLSLSLLLSLLSLPLVPSMLLSSIATPPFFAIRSRLRCSSNAASCAFSLFSRFQEFASRFRSFSSRSRSRFALLRAFRSRHHCASLNPLNLYHQYSGNQNPTTTGRTSPSARSTMAGTVEMYMGSSTPIGTSQPAMKSSLTTPSCCGGTSSHKCQLAISGAQQSATRTRATTLIRSRSPRLRKVML